MTDQHPAEDAWNDAWPALRKWWIDNSKSVQDLVHRAFLSGHDQRSAELARRAYTPDSNRKPEIERLPGGFRPAFLTAEPAGTYDWPAPHWTPKPVDWPAAADEGAMRAYSVPPGTETGFLTRLPADYRQHGTVTGRIGPMGRRDPGKTAKLAQAYGATDVPEEPPPTREDTMLIPRMSDAAEEWLWGAPGPVPTAVEGDDADS